MSARLRQDGFRARVRAGDTLVGTFVKTPHPAVIEVLGFSGLDCLCIDAEHAPIDRGTLDVMLLAARARDLPVLVRVAHADPPTILNALDLGATGVVLPHVHSAAQALSVARACRFGPDGRGYAGSTRSADFGNGTLGDNLTRGNATVTVVAQIEDAAALDEIDAIAAIGAIDALFIGRMDLTVSLGETSPMAPKVMEAVEAICAAARRHGRAFGMFTPTTAESLEWARRGASLFLLQSDQAWLLSGAQALRASFERG